MRADSKRSFAPYLMLIPWMIGFIVFKICPILISFVYSLMEYPILGDPEFIGFGNYVHIFTSDDVFRSSIAATMKYVLIDAPCVLVTSFFIAYILNFKLKGVNLFHTTYYIPSILGGNVAVSILWIQLFDVNGPVNILLGIFGAEPVFWLKEESFTVITLILLETWRFGSTMLIFLAALRNISASLYEAANLDGATKLQQLFRITLPIITPMLLFNMVNVLVKAFQEFNSAYLIAKSGPNYTAYFLNVYIYDQTFMNGNYGYASTLTWILLLIIGTLTALVFSSSKYWVYYND